MSRSRIHAARKPWFRRWQIPVVVLLAAGASLNVGLAGAATDPQGSARVVAATASVQTPPNFDDERGGEANADDPAIWVHPTNSGKSLVVGALKGAGLSVFDLSGKQLQRLAAPKPADPEEKRGKINNVDVLYGIMLGGKRMDLVVASEGHSDQIRIYAIDPAKAARGVAPLRDVTAPDVPWAFSRTRAEVIEGNTAYGLAAYRSGNDGMVVVTQEGRTRIGLFKLVGRANGKVGYTRVRTLTLPKTFDLPGGKKWTPCDDPDEDPQAEGLAIDTERNMLYVTQEVVGLWRVPASLQGEPRLIDKAKEFGLPGTYNTGTEDCEFGANPGYGGTHLAVDVEGVTIYHRGGGRGYLMVSSQGNDRYAVYTLDDGNRFLGSFRINAGKIDGVQHTDGLDVVNVRVGQFTQGLLVVQDGENTPGETAGGEPRENTNFKFVGWQNVAKAFSPPLAVDTTGYHPRRG